MHLLTVDEVAARLSRSARCVRELIRAGSLPIVDTGGDLDPHRRGRKNYRVSPADLDAWIASRTRRLAPSGPAVRQPEPKAAARTVIHGLIDEKVALEFDGVL